MSQPKPHLLVGKINVWGEPYLDIECPYEFGEDRPCTLGMPLPDGERCLWHEYESEQHHESCPAAKWEDGECANPDAGCWPEEPPVCEGFHAEGEHMHPVPGCYADHLLSEHGWMEAITFGAAEKDAPTRSLALPMEVYLDFEDDLIHLTPWAEAKAMLEERMRKTREMIEEFRPHIHDRAVAELVERGVPREEAEDIIAKGAQAGEELRKATS